MNNVDNKDYKTIYDWSKISPEITHIAMDKNGSMFQYIGEPYLDQKQGIWKVNRNGIWIPVYIGSICWSHKKPFTGDWTQSLEARPVEQNKPEPGINQCLKEQGKANFDQITEMAKNRPPEEVLAIYRELKSLYRQFNEVTQNIDNAEKEIRSIKAVDCFFSAQYEKTSGRLIYDLTTCKLLLKEQ